MEISDADLQTLLEAYRETTERQKRQIGDAEDACDSLQRHIESMQEQLEEAQQLICQLCATTELDIDGKPVCWTTAYENEGIPNVVSERNALREELSSVRERMNALAVSNAKLEQEVERLKGESKWQSHYEDFCCQLACTCDDEIEGKYLEAGWCGQVISWLANYRNRMERAVAANQEAADVLRLIEVKRLNCYPMSNGLWRVERDGEMGATQAISLRIAIQLWADKRALTLSAKDEQPAYNVATEEEARAAGLGPFRSWETKAKPLVPPEPAAEMFSYSNYGIVRNGFHVASFHVSNISEAHACIAYLNGTSPVHKKLDGMTKEVARLANELLERGRQLRDLRRDREAWDAVREYCMYLQSVGQPIYPTDKQWRACQWGPKASEYRSDPREAVLELAKTLEGGK